jgi:rRNA maturation endonuclease Nob1
MKYNDIPRAEMMRQANKALQDNAESNPEIHFKFTCEQCGERCMLSDANKLYAKGECHVCGHETKIEKGGFCVLFNLKPDEQFT